MKKVLFVFISMISISSQIEAIQVIPVTSVLGKVVLLPAVVVPAVRLFGTRVRRNKPEAKPSSALQVIQKDNAAVPVVETPKTLAQLREERDRKELELKNLELDNAIAARKDKVDLDHKQKKADVFLTYARAAGEISMQALMWSVRIFGFRTPFGGDRD